MRRPNLASILLLAIASGCAAGVGDAPTEESGLVERASAIALAIESDPDATEQILDSHGLSADAFEQMLLEISDDPAMRKAYTERLESAGRP